MLNCLYLGRKGAKLKLESYPNTDLFMLLSNGPNILHINGEDLVLELCVD